MKQTGFNFQTLSHGRISRWFITEQNGGADLVAGIGHETSRFQMYLKTYLMETSVEATRNLGPGALASVRRLRMAIEIHSQEPESRLWEVTKVSWLRRHWIQRASSVAPVVLEVEESRISAQTVAKLGRKCGKQNKVVCQRKRCDFYKPLWGL